MRMSLPSPHVKVVHRCARARCALAAILRNADCSYVIFAVAGPVPPPLLLMTNRLLSTAQSTPVLPAPISGYARKPRPSPFPLASRCTFALRPVAPWCRRTMGC